MAFGPVEDVRIGREVVAEGRLKPLRRSLGLTKSAMAELLYTSLTTYRSWEERQDTALWPTTAGRVGRFWRSASYQVEMIKGKGIKVEELVPIYVACTLLGIPQETLMKWCREGRFDAVDMGILGLWIYRQDMDRIKPSNRAKLRSVNS